MFGDFFSSGLEPTDSRKSRSCTCLFPLARRDFDRYMSSALFLQTTNSKRRKSEPLRVSTLCPTFGECLSQHLLPISLRIKRKKPASFAHDFCLSVPAFPAGHKNLKVERRSCCWKCDLVLPMICCSFLEDVITIPHVKFSSAKRDGTCFSSLLWLSTFDEIFPVSVYSKNVRVLSKELGISRCIFPPFRKKKREIELWIFFSLE